MCTQKNNILETAFEWHALLADEDISDSQKEAFALWLQADPQHKKAYAQANELWLELGSLRREDLDEEFFQPSWQELCVAWLRNMIQKVTTPYKPAMAASGIVAFALFFLVVHLQEPNGPQLPVTPHKSYATSIGEIRTINLADGSTITLGAKTAIDIDFSQTARHISMSNGEAFFQVSKDASRPFTVTSGDVRVTVHGTVFTVRKSETSARVAVSQGVVGVNYATQHTEEAPPAGKHTAVTLVAGEQLTLQHHGQTSAVAAIKPEMVGVWRENIRIYIDAPLSEIITDINRHRARKITFADSSLADVKVTATLNSNNAHTMLQTLATALPLRLEELPEKTILHPATQKKIQ